MAPSTTSDEVNDVLSDHAIDEHRILVPISSTEQPVANPLPLATLEDDKEGDTPADSDTASDIHVNSVAHEDEVDYQQSAADSELVLYSELNDSTAKPRSKKFSDEAMRVLDVCESLLSKGTRTLDCDEVLSEIGQLKKRYMRSNCARPTSPSRCSITRNRRYSLGSEARRVLKGWVDKHLNDPYPTMVEKHDLSHRAGLSIKQVNDWFTNYR